MKRIFVDPEKCIMCYLCQQVCSLHKEGTVQPESALVRVRREGMASIDVCLQCDNKMCMDVCLPKAMSTSPVGAVIIDPEKCDGCGKCVGACSNSAIVLIPDVVAKVCDLCSGSPECVTICPTGAIRYEETDEIREKKVAATGQKLLGALERR